MFGFVLANRSLLTQEQLARYRSCYCGLCGEIGHTYGSLQRFALNYDMTFLVLLLSSLYEPEEAASSVRCVAHPWKPHAQWRNAFTAYAAAMNVALAYYQCMDDWEDEKSFYRDWKQVSFPPPFLPLKQPIPGRSTPSNRAWRSFTALSSRMCKSRIQAPISSAP